MKKTQNVYTMMLDSQGTSMNQDNETKIGKQTFCLMIFYKHFLYLLDVFFQGYLMIPDDRINMNYLRLCSKIENILMQTGFEDLAAKNWRPFENLRGLSDVADVEWEYGRQLCGDFLSAVEESYISQGEKEYPLDTADAQLLRELRENIEVYQKRKADYEKRWLMRVESEAEKFQSQMEQTDTKSARTLLPSVDFSFISNNALRALIQKDYEEVKRTYQAGAFKSTIVLCGAILEAALVDALMLEGDKAKFDYYQKYLQNKKEQAEAPEIEKWELYRLVDIAYHRGIVKADVKRLAHIVRDYRNLVHLFYQLKEGLQANKEIASAVASLLTIALVNITEWHTQRTKG
ncbi:MAG: hypothetical protein FJ004_08485 [Chloroflexi bacterium]|nr:hypothetical protein [Chloroflexota bacterium]